MFSILILKVFKFQSLQYAVTIFFMSIADVLLFNSIQFSCIELHVFKYSKMLSGQPAKKDLSSSFSLLVTTAITDRPQCINTKDHKNGSISYYNTEYCTLESFKKKEKRKIQ